MLIFKNITQKYLSLLILGTFIFQYSVAQKYPLLFAEHLYNQKKYEETILVLQAHSESDSVFFLAGKTNYALQNLEQAARQLVLVKPGFPKYTEAHFFAGLCHAYTGEEAKALSIFEQIQTEEINETDLKRFEMSAAALLNRNFEAYRKHKVASDYYAVSQEIAKLQKIADELAITKRKSPVLAAGLSALVPGVGKMYVGKTGEGLAALLTLASMGLLSWENYSKLGLQHPKTIIFGSIFAGFYLGNIYGSALSVKLSNQKIQDAYNQQILFNMHIPLRNHFGQ